MMTWWRWRNKWRMDWLRCNFSWKVFAGWYIKCSVSWTTTTPPPPPIMMFANDRDRRCGVRVTVKLHNYIANLCLFAYYFRLTCRWWYWYLFTVVGCATIDVVVFCSQSVTSFFISPPPLTHLQYVVVHRGPLLFVPSNTLIYHHDQQQHKTTTTTASDWGTWSGLQQVKITDSFTAARCTKWQI